MENPLTLSLWVGVALYAALGLCGVALFHDATPSIQSLTDGYGIAYQRVVTSEIAK